MISNVGIKPSSSIVVWKQLNQVVCGYKAWGKNYVGEPAEFCIIMTRLCRHYFPDYRICTRVSY